MRFLLEDFNLVFDTSKNIKKKKKIKFGPFLKKL